jgi:hypothetical protein
VHINNSIALDDILSNTGTVTIRPTAGSTVPGMPNPGIGLGPLMAQVGRFSGFTPLSGSVIRFDVNVAVVSSEKYASTRFN